MMFNIIIHKIGKKGLEVYKVIKVLGIDHINFVVKDVEEGQRFWSDLLGIKLKNIREMPRLDIKSCRAREVGEPVKAIDITPSLTVYEPLTPDGPEARSLAKKGEGVTVVVFAVENIKDAVEHFKAQGIEPFLASERTAFFRPRDTHGVRVELMEGWLYRKGVDR